MAEFVKTDFNEQPLSGYFFKSALIHALVFSLIVYLLVHESKQLEVQEQRVIDSVKEKEKRTEEAERQAQEEATKSSIEDKLQAELDELISGELDIEHEQELSQMTEDDIEDLLAETGDLFDMSQEDLYEVMGDLRVDGFKEMVQNLKEMEEKILLEQIDSYIEKKVAPEIKQRIENELKHKLGEDIKKEAVTQTGREKRERHEALAKEVDSLVSEMDSLKKEQYAVRDEIGKKDYKKAAEKQDEISRKEFELSEKAEKLLESAKVLSPASTETISNLEKKKLDDRVSENQSDSSDMIKKEDQNESYKAVDKTVKTMDERLNEYRKLSSDLRKAGADRKPDDIQRYIVQKSEAQIEKTVREQVEEKITEEAVPIASKRMMKALDEDLKKHDLNNDEFKAKLEERIKDKLGKAMEKNKPDTKVALLKTEEEFKLQDLDSLEKIQQDIQKAVRRLEHISKQETALRDAIIKETADKDAAEQREIVKKMSEVKSDVSEILQKVARTTVMVEHDVNEARNSLKSRVAEAKGREAAESIQHEAVQPAKNLMTQAVNDLKKPIEKLKKLDSRLGKQVELIAKTPGVEVEFGKGSEEEKHAEGEAQELAKKALNLSEQKVPGEVQKAAREVEMEDVLAGAGELDKMAELQGKLQKVAKNLEEGRDFGEMGAELTPLPPGAGMGAGGQMGKGGRMGRFRGFARGTNRFNRKAYEEFVKDLKERQNPDNYYDDADSAEGLASKAAPRTEEGAALIYISAEETDDKTNDENRKIPEPRFKSKAFAGIPMAEKPITIDGDLSDWGELTNPLPIQYSDTSADKIDTGMKVYVRWCPEGLYFGYMVAKKGPIIPNPDTPYAGDCLEVWLDMANTRRETMGKSSTSHQFCFNPWGYKGDTKATFTEIGRGFRGLKYYEQLTDTKKVRGYSAGKVLEGYGYSVECFLRRRAIAKPNLIPGKIAAMNVSVNLGGGGNHYQWAASKVLQTWNKPDTWGDVLFLGTDGKVRFLTYENPDRSLEGIVPGDPLIIEISDRDMDLNFHKFDRISTEVMSGNGLSTVFAVLEETGPNTGVFRGSVSTQQYFMPPKANTLNVKGGGTLVVNYTDLRAAFGEKNRPVKESLKVGWPVMKVGE